MIFRGIIDKIKSKIFPNSLELPDKICSLKFKFITGKNIELIKIDENATKNKIAKNRNKIFVLSSLLN